MAATETSCRIAFYGKVIEALPQEKDALSVLRIFKPKQRTGCVDRVTGPTELIGTNLLEKGGNILPVWICVGNEV